MPRRLGCERTDEGQAEVSQHLLVWKVHGALLCCFSMLVSRPGECGVNGDWTVHLLR